MKCNEGETSHIFENFYSFKEFKEDIQMKSDNTCGFVILKIISQQ